MCNRAIAALECDDLQLMTSRHHEVAVLEELLQAARQAAKDAARIERERIVQWLRDRAARAQNQDTRCTLQWNARVLERRGK